MQPLSARLLAAAPRATRGNGPQTPGPLQAAQHGATSRARCRHARWSPAPPRVTGCSCRVRRQLCRRDGSPAAPLTICASAESTEERNEELLTDKSRLATFIAHVRHSRPLPEGHDSSAMVEFLHSDDSTPSLFSSAVSIQPIEDYHGDSCKHRRFKVQAQKFQSPGLEFDPITVFSVSAAPDGCVMSQDEAYLIGKPEQLIESINQTTTQQTLVNRLFVREAANEEDDSIPEEAGAYMVVSECKLSITCGLPKWLKFVPIRAVEATGSQLFRSAISAQIDSALGVLLEDYQKWYERRDSESS